MKYWFCFLLGVCLYTNVEAQPAEENITSKELYETARNYILKGDFANAILVYNQAVQSEPKNLVYRRELAYAYYLNGDMIRGEAMIKPLLKATEADPETFLVASKIYSKMNNVEMAKDAIQLGISKFPNQGSLYEEKGQLLTLQKNYKAAAGAWEEGVEKAPAFHKNYYNLCKAYFLNKNYVWAILYAEHYINLESFSARTEEAKKILFDSYKFLLAELNNLELRKKNTDFEPETFEECFSHTIKGLRNVVTGGITSENLVMLRVRFLLEWNKLYAKTFPYELFDYQQQLLVHGLFEAYNAWIFGRHENENAHKAWAQKNAILMNRFDTYFRGKKLQPKFDQYYKN